MRCCSSTQEILVVFPDVLHGSDSNTRGFRQKMPQVYTMIGCVFPVGLDGSIFGEEGSDFENCEEYILAKYNQSGSLFFNAVSANQHDPGNVGDNQGRAHANKRMEGSNFNYRKSCEACSVP